MDRPPWYASAFGRDYVERYARRSVEAAAGDVPFLLRALSLPPDARVLDLCCGAGRHSLGLAQAGLAVLGVDLSRELLVLAHEATAGARFARADMRALPFQSGTFDGVVNLFTSFGYFEEEKENLLVLQEVSRVMRGAGVLVLDFFNLEGTLRTLVPQSERKFQGGRIVEVRAYDPVRKRLEKRSRVEGQARGEVREIFESVRAYSPEELSGLFRQAGLTVAERYGDLLGALFDESASPRCVSVARKTG